MEVPDDGAEVELKRVGVTDLNMRVCKSINTWCFKLYLTIIHGVNNFKNLIKLFLAPFV